MLHRIPRFHGHPKTAYVFPEERTAVFTLSFAKLEIWSEIRDINGANVDDL
jgi:hypothetical protein